jgi:hypothetical protein
MAPKNGIGTQKNTPLTVAGQGDEDAVLKARGIHERSGNSTQRLRTSTRGMSAFADEQRMSIKREAWTAIGSGAWLSSVS